MGVIMGMQLGCDLASYIGSYMIMIALEPMIRKARIQLYILLDNIIILGLRSVVIR